MAAGKRRKRTKSTSRSKAGIIAISFVVIMLAAVISVKKIELKEKKQEYLKRIETLQAQIDAEENRTAELDNYKTYVQTKKYVEEVARDKLGLVYEDEIIFKPE